MKIIVVSKGHISRLHTFKWLDKLRIQYLVVTHTKDQANTISLVAKRTEDIIATGKKFLYENRNYALRRLIRKGEWFIGMDDNIQLINKVRDDYYEKLLIDQELKPCKAKTWREIYRQNSTDKMLDLCYELMDQCKAWKTIYGGFASLENPYFRQRHWSRIRFVKSKLYVMKNCGQKFSGIFGHDSRMSAQIVAQYGGIAVNNFVHPVHTMYEEGGLGHVTQRRPILDKHLAEICKDYPGLVMKGRGANTALRFCITSQNGLTKWREEYKYVRRST